MHVEREHFLVICRLDGVERTLLWFSDHTDGLVVDAERRVMTFPDRARAAAYAHAHGLRLSGDAPALYDLDQLRAWHTQRRTRLACRDALSGWNLFTDIAASAPDQAAAFRAADQADDAVYDKLFWGKDLPPVSSRTWAYEPSWSDEEIAQLSHVLAAGIELTRAVLSGAH